jgi:hypothetical protein
VKIDETIYANLYNRLLKLGSQNSDDRPVVYFVASNAWGLNGLNRIVQIVLSQVANIYLSAFDIEPSHPQPRQMNQLWKSIALQC